MNATAIKAMMGELAPVIREYVAAEMADVRAENEALKAANAEQARRMAALEAREMPSLEGYVTTETAKSLITDAVAAAIAEIPVPKDGKSVDPEEVQAMVDKAVAALPVAQDGKDGADGRDGADGASVEVKDVLPALEKQVSDFLATIPLPKDGEPGAKGEPGRDGKDGRDGLDVKDLFRADGGRLMAVMSDGTTKDLGVFVGKDGAPGKDGETFTLDDFDIEQTDERTLEFKFLRGDTMHTFELEFPVPIFRGAWKEGAWRKGDMAVWGGSLWAATKDTDAKPDSPDSGWMIAARKGRDGKNA